MSPQAKQIWTIGHWTCPEDTFIGMLAAQRIDLLADVRSSPGSRATPHFVREAMLDWLESAGVEYVHVPELGGRRKRDPDAGDVNAGWHNPSFRNYADHTLGAEYARGIATLEDLAADRRVAVMCAEPMPWRCHRLLIANTLTARGWTVRHIIGEDGLREHRLGQWGAAPVVTDDDRVVYP